MGILLYNTNQMTYYIAVNLTIKSIASDSLSISCIDTYEKK